MIYLILLKRREVFLHPNVNALFFLAELILVTSWTWVLLVTSSLGEGPCLGVIAEFLNVLIELCAMQIGAFTFQMLWSRSSLGLIFLTTIPCLSVLLVSLCTSLSPAFVFRVRGLLTPPTWARLRKDGMLQMTSLLTYCRWNKSFRIGSATLMAVPSCRSGIC